MIFQLFLCLCFLLGATAHAALPPHGTVLDTVPTVLREEAVQSADLVQLLSDTRFQLVDGPAFCPRSIEHGTFRQDAHPNAYASIAFSEITVSYPDGASTCGVGTGIELLTVGTGRLFEGLSVGIPIPEGVYFYGVDGVPRECGAVTMETTLAYLFTKDIGVFVESMRENGLFSSTVVEEQDMDVGRVWMVSLPTDGSVSLCLFKETEKFIEPTPMATPEAEEEGEEIIEVAGEDESVEDRPPSVFGTATDLQIVQAEERSCFPGSAHVTLEDGGKTTMARLQVGDRVLAKSGVYSEVFLFTHKRHSGMFEFVEVELESGHEMTVSEGHYVYVNGKYVAAGNVRVGDWMEGGDGRESRVARIGKVVARGLFNPQTVDGDIVVDNVRASTYTTAVEATTAHALLCPVRAMFYGRIVLRWMFSGWHSLN